MVSQSLSRRRLLGSLVGTATAGAVAGCSEYIDTAEETESGVADDGTTETTEGSAPTGDDGGSDTTADDSSDTTADDTPTTTEESDSETTAESELDLREANVVGVEFESENGSYTFDVTLHHDDEGEDGYANWWQVERLDGTQLGRRELLHAHSQQPFTRSERIEIPDGVTCVVVRGHDETHEYGGQAMLVNLESGATRAVEQGAEKQSFDSSECP